jgi:hypothetical protein
MFVMMYECIDICLCSVCVCTRTVYSCMCVSKRRHSLSFSPSVSISLTQPHTRSLALCLSHTFSRTHALFSCVRAHAHLQTLSSLLTDPKTKDLWSNPDSPESRALLLKTFGSKFSPEECQKKVLSATPRMIRDSFYAWDGD